MSKDNGSDKQNHGLSDDHGHGHEGHAFVSENSPHDWLLCILSCLTSLAIIGLLTYWAGLPLPEVEESHAKSESRHK